VGDGGAERESPDVSGLGSLTVQALAEGTTSKSANELATAFERLGAELECDADWAHAESSVTVLSGRVGPALSLLAEVVRSASLPDDGIIRLRHERLAELLQQRAEPRGLADDLFAQCCFAAGDRFAYPIGGSERTVSSCSPERVRQHYGERYRPDTSLLVIAGDVEPDEAIRMGEQEFGSWHVAGIPEVMGMTPTPRTDREVHIGHRSDAPQSEIRIGHASVPRTHPDFHAITVMNAILGGLFNSRINLNLRERHGYTYGAFSSFDWRRSGSLFEISSAVKSDVTAAAITEVMQEITRLRAEHVTPDELSLARDFLTGVFPLRYETTAAIANAVAFRWSFDLGASYHDEYRARIAAVTADDVARVANERLHPDCLQIVVVGDADQISSPLEALGLGAVRREAVEI
jgi:zinc protease